MDLFIVPIVQEKLITEIEECSAHTYRVTLADGVQTTVHAVRYDLSKVKPRVVVFDGAQRLSEYCRENKVADAIGGGFFLRKQYLPLGDHWVAGKQIKSEPFTRPWDKIRGSILIPINGVPVIDTRNELSPKPENDLLQAGPLLLKDGVVQVSRNEDTEGFSSGESQFDSDITAIRHPRAAIGLSAEHIWAVVCDGRINGEAGLQLDELAEFMGSLGAHSALNLDGGSSASLVHCSKLLNISRSDAETVFKNGRPIFSAITFQQ